MARARRLRIALSLLSGLLLVACSSDAPGSPDLDTSPTLEVILSDDADTRPSLDVSDAADATDVEVGPCPGCIGAPCTSASDCNSGYCLPGPNGSWCTETCTETCPRGWSCRPTSNGGADIAFICVYDHLTLCSPCESNTDCTDPLAPTGGNRCLPLGEGLGSFCATSCGDDDDCPDGMECELIDGKKSCRPASGECTCTPWATLQGRRTTCNLVNEFGTCKGSRACGENGLEACGGAAAAAETCNGKDDDCDGGTDEEVIDAIGTCDGDDDDSCEDDRVVCVGGSLVCENRAGGELAETCNGVDDDCDGLTDADDPGLWLPPCERTDGLCAGAAKNASLCIDGVWTACGEAVYAALGATLSGEVRCDGLDDDCDGKADEDFVYQGEDGLRVAGGGASCGSGACGGGLTRCAPNGEGLLCTTEGQAQGEICNGLDDDCDGAVDRDDDSLVREPCELQAGVCAGVSKPVSTCFGGGYSRCSDETYATASEAYQAGLELSCDGLDNDCDGASDEDFAVTMPDGRTSRVGQSCGVGLCAGGIARCGGEGLVCSTAGNARTEVCNGLDDDCDGLVDSADPDLLRPLCERQDGVCAGTSKPASLCGAEAPGVWSTCGEAVYAAHANAYAAVEQRCDGVDEDCDGRVDDDFGANTPDGARVFGVGTACGAGACAGGVLVCDASGAGVVCSSLGSVSAEVCDGTDNDCDGRTDGLDPDLVRVACSNGNGLCAGALALADNCVAGAWLACSASDYAAHDSRVATTEGRCDGLDEDCDGRVDEDFSLALPDGTTVTGAGRGCGAGACTGGVTVCAPNGTAIFCDSSIATATEVCDGEDNDCDGLTDAADPDLERPLCDEQRGECAGARKPPSLCVDGEWKGCDSAVYGNHSTRYDGATELRCDGRDNDCDGRSDEDFALVTAADVEVRGAGASCGAGVCAGGVAVCNPGGDGIVCPGEARAKLETCDGIDNDCDGETDAADTDLVVTACELSDGVCSGAIHQATDCVEGRFIACDEADYRRRSTFYEAGLELRCDGRDNDCDGRLDEDFSLVDREGTVITGAGTACGGGICEGGLAVCNPNGDGLVCDTERALLPETCNGLDDDCDGQTDAVDPGLVRIACDLQAGSCAGAVRPASLCVDGSWRACTRDVYANHSVDFEGDSERSCDGRDNDCDGRTDDDFVYAQRDGSTVSGVGTACGRGVCAGGSLVCDASGRGVTCEGEARASSETCDGKDDDCDGFTDSLDQDLVLVPCERQAGVCDAATKPAALCQSGSWASCSDAIYGVHNASYEAQRERSCDGLDNDCDGQRDEDFSLNLPDGLVASGLDAACGSGVCAGGKTLCNEAGRGLVCSSLGASASEVCNGLDDDCDGLVDAVDPDLERVSCENTAGVCQGALKPVGLCVAGAWQACGATHYAAHAANFQESAENRCDGLDEDCDGSTDEDFRWVDPLGTAIPVGARCGLGICGDGETRCAPDRSGLLCSTSGLAIPERCDGRDDDCDGVVDEGCDDDGDDFCDATMSSPNHSPVCAFGGGDCDDSAADVRPGTSETCDRRDEDCDGQTDEAFTDCAKASCEALGAGTFGARLAEGCAVGDCVPSPLVSCGLYACADAVCGASCANDAQCASAAHCSETTERCVADFADGAACLEASDCVSGHCQNGFCCSGGDCCAAAANCPASYSRAPVCDVAGTCQGTRRDKTCVANVCGTSAPIADDRGCLGTTLSQSCGPAYLDVMCTGAESQSAPQCAVSCVGDSACTGAYHCDGTCVADVVDGGRCDEASDCVSGHCQNGFCCASGDCCGAAGDCPASYRSAPVCEDGATCQGSRIDAVCSNAICGSSSAIGDDSACGLTTVANGCGFFASVTCSGSADQPPPACPTGCTSDPGCDTDAHCDGICVADVVNGGLCDEASDCVSGHCQNGRCCSGGDCCATAAECPAAYSVQPVCDFATTCQGTKDVATCANNVCGTTVDVADDSACTLTVVSKDCGPYPTVRCSGGSAQTEPPCATSCTSDAQCDANAYCRSGVCRPDEGDGGVCEDAAECKSGHCQQGYCCASGDCCRTASDCAVAVYGEVPNCGSIGTCQGYRRDPVCSANVCAMGPSVDDDSGCGGLEANLCGPYPSAFCASLQVQQTPQCATRCTVQADCDAGAYCAADGTCKSDQGAGGACTSSLECASGLSCVDGVCCTSSCTGSCRRCDLSGDGTCTFVGAGADPDNECAGFDCTGYHFGFIGDACTYKADVSSAEASCNGAGSCQTRDALCRAQSGVGPTGPTTCDATCQDPVPGTCSGTVPGACSNLDLGTVTCGLGTCARTVPRCVGGAVNACTPGPSGDEFCNALDDDCDGITDASDPDLTTDDPRLCELQSGVCAGADKPAKLCASGQWGSCGTAEYESHDGRYDAGSEATCEGLDNDCDSKTDEDFTMVGKDGRSFVGVGAACGVGRCTGGTTRCKTSGTGTECSTESLAQSEVCNGIDDDCDAIADRLDPDLERVLCENQKGVCSGSVKPPSLCGASAWASCGDTQYVAFSSAYQSGVETRCDGLDNDCDASTDEHFTWTSPGGATVTGVGKSCGTGRCANGVTTCNATGNGIVCSTDGLVEVEVCNGVDDDCDGLTDTADSDLIVPLCEDQDGACKDAKKPLALCRGTLGWAVCGVQDYAAAGQPNRLRYQSGSETSCDGIDNDCDAATDEDFSMTLKNGSNVSGVGILCGVGVCANGRTECLADGTGITCPSEANAGPERCDGSDNDCDGSLDAADTTLVLDACEKTEGVCAGTKRIASECVSGAWRTCDPSRYGVNYQAGSEKSCDGLDNDCGGGTDEDFSYAGPDGVVVTGGIGKACGVGRCAGGTTLCNAAKTGVTCSTATLARDEACGRVDTTVSSFDDDCDGLTDGSDIVVFANCSNQTGECQGSKQTDGRQCVSGVWQACDSTDYSATAGRIWQSSESLCDSRDNDCNGTTDGGDLVGDEPLNSVQVGVCLNTRKTCSSGVWVDNLPATYGAFEAPNEVPGQGVLDENCDGIDGTLSSALLVSSSGTGTSCNKAVPCTLATALSLVSNKPHIYVMAGNYENADGSAYNLSRAVSIYGGYSTNWTRGDYRSNASFLAKINGGTWIGQYIGLRVVGTSSSYLGTAQSPVRIQDLEIVGPAASGTLGSGHGKSSYVVYANFAHLAMLRVTLTQGTGAPGRAGSDGSSASQVAAPAGAAGESAENFSTACNSDRRQGGGGATNASCVDSSATTGGRGGNGGQMDTSCGFIPDLDATSGIAGSAATSSAVGFGTGGGGGALCLNGGVGAGVAGRRSDGNAGSAASHAYGRMSASFFEGVQGGSGALGADGTGGGGGGGSGGCDTGTDSRGAGGGGGGAGGCRAPTAGGGGFGGGGSFGVFAFDAFVSIDRVIVTRTTGGAGGAGGAGGTGQPGGNGGAGGASNTNVSAGGSGGKGGSGGHSGGGGGGSGGPSWSVFWFGTTVGATGSFALVGTGNSLGGLVGSGGAGGAGGVSPGNDGARGPTGVSGEVYQCKALGACGP